MNKRLKGTSLGISGPLPMNAESLSANAARDRDRYAAVAKEIEAWLKSLKLLPPRRTPNYTDYTFNYLGGQFVLVCVPKGLSGTDFVIKDLLSNSNKTVLNFDASGNHSIAKTHKLSIDQSQAVAAYLLQKSFSPTAGTLEVKKL